MIYINIKDMIPADKIYHILEDLNKLREERNYTRDRLDSIRQKMLPLVDRYHWHKDEFVDLVNRKGKLLGYKHIKKEIEIMDSLLDYIEKLLKKKEFAEGLAEQDIDIEQFKRAININKLKLKILKDHNKECRKKMKNFVTFIRINADKEEFKKALAEWDEAQAKVAYVDRLENSLEKRAIVEQAQKFPESVKEKGGLNTATAVAIAAMIAFGAVTADYTVKGGISFGGGSAEAGEIQTQAPYKTNKELLEALKGAKYLGTRIKDKFSELPGKDAILKGYRLGNKTITTYEFKENNRIYAFATKENGKFRWYPDRNGDGYFEDEEEKADIQLQKYGFRAGN